MTKTLQHNPHIVLVSEFWPYGLRKAGSSALSYYDELKKLGFEILLIGKSGTQMLGREDVEKLEGQGVEHYHNILAKRIHV
jgi:hypothetical protein